MANPSKNECNFTKNYLYYKCYQDCESDWKLLFFDFTQVNFLNTIVIWFLP